MSLCVCLRLPESLASQWPTPDVQGMPPHITVLYITDEAMPAEPERLEAMRQVFREVVGAVRSPLYVSLDGLDHFDNPGESVAVVKVSQHGPTALRKELLAELAARGFSAVQKHPEYRPHATLGYLPPGGRWTGPVPEGHADIAAVEVWGSDGLLETLRAGAAGLRSGAVMLRELKDSEGRRMYRALSTGPIYSRDGTLRATLTEADLREIKRLFDLRSRGPQALDPVGIDREHAASRQVDAPTSVTLDGDGKLHVTHPTDSFGLVDEVYVGRFGGHEQVGLYVVPAFTAAGEAMRAGHMLADGSGRSTLWSSPDLVLGEVYAREGGPDGEKKLIGTAMMRRWSLTTSPSQVTTAAEPVALSEQGGSAMPEPEEMTPDTGAEGAEGASSNGGLAMRIADLEAGMAKLAAMVEKALNPEPEAEGEQMGEAAPAPTGEAAVVQLREQLGTAQKAADDANKRLDVLLREQADERFAQRLKLCEDTGRALKADTDGLRKRRQAMLAKSVAYQTADELLSEDIAALEKRAPLAAVGGGERGLPGGKPQPVTGPATGERREALLREARDEAKTRGVADHDVLSQWARNGDPRSVELNGGSLFGGG